MEVSIKTKHFLLAAGIVLAMAFTFSCSSDDGGGGGGDGSSSGVGGNACSADFGSITIDSQVWAKKNLDCDVEGSKCYDDDPANCTKYGRLYDWNTAKTACPNGWHLPSDEEWDVLVNHAGDSSTAGAKLKATSGWNIGNGTDDFGFTALPGGYGSGGNFGNVGYYGGWWTATEYGSYYAYDRYMNYSNSYVDRDKDGKSYLFSVRCVRD